MAAHQKEKCVGEGDNAAAACRGGRRAGWVRQVACVGGHAGQDGACQDAACLSGMRGMLAVVGNGACTQRQVVQARARIGGCHGAVDSERWAQVRRSRGLGEEPVGG
jgi:hypothetical protein